MADNGITKDDLFAAFDRYFGKGGKSFSFDTDNIEAFEKQLKQTTDGMKKGQGGLTTFAKSLRGISEPINDFKSEFASLSESTKKLEESLDDLAKQAEQAMKDGDLEKKAKIDSKMAEIQGTQAKNQSAAVTMKGIAVSKALQSTFSQITVAGIDYVNSMIENSLQFASGLQAGTAGTELYANAAINVTKANAKLVGTVEDIVAGAAGLLAALGLVFPPLELFAGGLGALAVLLHLSKTTLDKYAEGQKLLSDELTATKKAFQAINSAGSVLGGGMTELRNQASEAGLTVSQWGDVIKISSKDIQDMGGGMADAQKRLAKIGGALRTSGLDEQLTKLGMSYEEQVSLAAQVSAGMVAAGDKRKNNELEVAQVTANYAKDLKVLALITGEDAKKAMEKAKSAAMEADILSKARRSTGGPEAVLKMQQAIAQADALGIKKGFMEYVSSGGKAVMDTATNVAMTQNREYGNFMKQSLGDVQDANVSAHQAMENSAQNVTKATQRSIELSDSGQLDSIGLASRASSATGELTGAMEILNKTLARGIVLQEDAANKTSQSATNSANNKAKLDQNNADLEKRAQLERVKQQDQFSGMLGTYTDKLKDSGEYLDTFKDSVMTATNYLNKMSGGSAKGTTPEAKQEKETKATYDKTMEGASLKQKWGIGRTKEQEEAFAAKYKAELAATQARSRGPGVAAPAGGAPTTPASTPAKSVTIPSARESAPEPGSEAPVAQGGGSTTPKLATVTSKSGKSASVGAAYSKQFQTLLDYLDSVGYDIKSLGGYADRDVRGKPGVKSVHAKGGALDINPGENPMGGKLVTDLPAQIGAISKSMGLGWGGDWKSIKDAMHFSAAENEGGTVKMYDNGGDITSGDLGIVGEKGPEIVQGPASVTSRSDTTALFNKMNTNLEAMLRVLKDQLGTSEKILWAQS